MLFMRTFRMSTKTSYNEVLNAFTSLVQSVLID